MSRLLLDSHFRTWVVVFAIVLTAPAVYAQDAPPPPPPGQTLSPDQLDDLVAPIALYPDPLLSQVLVAATYPLEIVQASQFMQRNPSLTGPALTQAAQEQNWDPSVQALVVFPDVVKRLNDDITWTTNLGNTFLSQQQDVMDAVQRMRQKAQDAGKLAPTPQQNVVTESQEGRPYIEIRPVDPEVIYVPAYDPVWIWGPPVWYPYPHWYWPPRSIVMGGVGFGFYGGINVGLFFGGGWGGWGGWGWHPGWGSRTIVVNNTFIHRYNFNTVNINNVHGTSVWAHNVEHRQGVPYASPALQQRYRGDVTRNYARPEAQPYRAPFQQGERFGNRQIPQNVPPAQNRSVFGGSRNSGEAARAHADHGYSSMGPARSMPAQRSAPPQRSAPEGRGRGREH